MATKTITWPDGTTAVLTYSGQGSGPITVQSDPNNHYEARSAQVTVKTTDGSNISRIVTITQAAKPQTPNFILSDGKYLLLSDGKYFNVQE